MEFSCRSDQNSLVAGHLLHHRLYSSNLDNTFLDQFNPTDLERRCLQVILGEKPRLSEGMKQFGAEDVVSLDKFGRVLDWFGPVCDPSGKLLFLQMMVKILSQRWFFGELSTREAELRLKDQPVGTFLVRFSTTSEGCYTISKMSHEGINHQRVMKHFGGPCKPQFFSVSNRKSASLDTLINSSSNVLGLIIACPGYPFDYLFQGSSDPSNSSLGYIPSNFSQSPPVRMIL
eukprot:TRINITY_DN2839_c0_g1_i1.p2 TRINITY_DN2839_c0_g1~~TRINITY_DN2839_c0_g1_i1.p2  ORF type:complete len:231 (-),score=42.04 TRINITY_DN2839_c0_g1_i1:43-735(-)